MRLVPKKDTGLFHLIHHLSSFAKVLRLLRRFGKSSLLANADIQSAVQILPVHPQGFNSLGFHFNGLFYFDKRMPMGFSKSCFLQWVLSKIAPPGGIIHYMDDFLCIGPADSAMCAYILYCFPNIC